MNLLLVLIAFQSIMNSRKEFVDIVHSVQDKLTNDWGLDATQHPTMRDFFTKYKKWNSPSPDDILKDIYDGMTEERQQFVDGFKLLTQLGRDRYSKSATHEILELLYSGATPQEITAKRTELHPTFAKAMCVTMIHNAMKKNGNDASREDATEFLDKMMSSVRTKNHQCGSDCTHDNGDASVKNSGKDSDETSSPVDKEDWHTTLRKAHQNRLALQEQIKIYEADILALELKKKREKRNKKRQRSREKKRNQSKKAT